VPARLTAGIPNSAANSPIGAPAYIPVHRAQTGI
jgi:hypothetical protein